MVTTSVKVKVEARLFRAVRTGFACAVLTVLAGEAAGASVMGGVQRATVWAVVYDLQVKDGACLGLVGFKDLTEFRQIHVWIYALDRPGQRRAFRHCSGMQHLIEKRPLPARRPAICLRIAPAWEELRSGDGAGPFELVRRLGYDRCHSAP